MPITIWSRLFYLFAYLPVSLAEARWRDSSIEYSLGCMVSSDTDQRPSYRRSTRYEVKKGRLIHDHRRANGFKGRLTLLFDAHLVYLSRVMFLVRDTFVFGFMPLYTTAAPFYSYIHAFI